MDFGTFSLEDLIAIGGGIYTIAVVISAAITSFFDTPHKPDEDDCVLYRIWYYFYTAMDMVRFINARTKQRPNVAITLKKLADRTRTEHLSADELSALMEDLAYTIGTRRAIEKAAKACADGTGPCPVPEQ